jgi:SAM-dependent methyltransferase
MKKNKSTKSSDNFKKADHYNDPTHNYLRYWDGRDYEHAAEVLAIHRILKGLRFKNAADIGGGYGRLSIILAEFADQVVLAEPSKQQLDLSKDFLRKNSRVTPVLMQADKLDFKDGSLDLVAMIRVMHHLPDPAPEFNEIARVLSSDGYFLLEIANYSNFKNRLKYALKGKKLPLTPVDIRSEANKKKDAIAFVNHNPKTVKKQLAHAGLKVERVLSVSNLRSPRLKKILPKKGMMALESFMQPALAKTYFGPSTFFLIKKA